VPQSGFLNKTGGDFPDRPTFNGTQQIPFSGPGPEEPGPEEPGLDGEAITGFDPNSPEPPEHWPPYAKKFWPNMPPPERVAMNELFDETGEIAPDFPEDSGYA
tara:strand:- start:5739 stop:6047 length:309 start_codon:yes stop_codon:yes gene_type:complete